MSAVTVVSVYHSLYGSVGLVRGNSHRVFLGFSVNTQRNSVTCSNTAWPHTIMI